ncbi:MAG: alpha/beta hydrolase [Chloroflexi bacterium]|nr:MAG: alpha/beta hydrolase [Chloroflexota bacterium]
MASNTSDAAVASGPQRRGAHVIHYNLSYVVQGAEHGTNRAIVLLHEIPAGAFAWADVMPQLASANRAVYAIDMLGYGQSEHPWPADTSNWGQADALSMLFEQLNLTNIVLVGHGLGGAVAQVLATRLSRERVAALVLIDTYCFGYSFAPNWPLSEMKKRQDVDAPKQTKVEDLIADLKETLPNGSYNPQRFQSFLSDYIEPWNSELGKEVLFQHIRLLIPGYTNSVSTDLKELGKPVLIIWGQNDQQVPLKFAERLHRDIAESELVIVPDAGHLILFDAPDSVASAIVDFVGKL